jgi:hypothetical protein
VPRITGNVAAKMQEQAARPLDAVYVAIFTGAVVVQVRDGQVAGRPVCAAIGVTTGGRKDVLGRWAGGGGEGARFWMSVLTDLKNRGVRDVFFLRRSLPLLGLLARIGLVLAGRAGARLAGVLGAPVHRTTLLRLVGRLTCCPTGKPRRGRRGCGLIGVRRLSAVTGPEVTPTVHARARRRRSR